MSLPNTVSTESDEQKRSYKRSRNMAKFWKDFCKDKSESVTRAGEIILPKMSEDESKLNKIKGDIDFFTEHEMVIYKTNLEDIKISLEKELERKLTLEEESELYEEEIKKLKARRSKS